MSPTVEMTPFSKMSTPNSDSISTVSCARLKESKPKSFVKIVLSSITGIEISISFSRIRFWIISIT